MGDLESNEKTLGSMPNDLLSFVLETIADLEELKAVESGNFIRESACRYREAVIREAVARLRKNELRKE